MIRLMKIELDPEGLRVRMEMWRKSMDMQIPLAPEIRIHFFARRGQLLDNYVKVASNWLMLLRSCKADGENLVALDQLETDIEAFKAWAEAGISELTRLATEELQVDPPAPGAAPD